MGKTRITDGFLVLSLLNFGYNDYKKIKEDIFFINENRLGGILFDLQNSLNVTITPSGIYLSKEKYQVVQGILDIEDDILGSYSEKFDFILEHLNKKYKKDLSLELRGVMKYV